MKYTLLLITALLMGLGIGNAQETQIPFKQAFAKARKELGAQGTFKWNGNLYTTQYVEEVQSHSNTTVSTTPPESDIQLRPATFADSVSYAIAVDFGRHMMGYHEYLVSKNREPIDVNIVIRALDDRINHRYTDRVPTREDMPSDSIAYLIGADYGHNVIEHNANFRRKGLEPLNISIIKQAFRDVMNYRPQITQSDAIRFLNDFFSDGIASKNLRESEEYIATVVESNPKIKTTNSGLLYEIIEPGDMNIRAQKDTDQVTVSYVGTLKDGTIVDHRENMTMQLNQALMGCKEGLRLIGKGGKIKLILHPNWADERQDMDDAPPNSTLIFEIELIDVLISR